MLSTSNPIWKKIPDLIKTFHQRVSAKQAVNSGMAKDKLKNATVNPNSAKALFFHYEIWLRDIVYLSAIIWPLLTFRVILWSPGSMIDVHDMSIYITLVDKATKLNAFLNECVLWHACWNKSKGERANWHLVDFADSPQYLNQHVEYEKGSMQIGCKFEWLLHFEFLAACEFEP